MQMEGTIEEGGHKPFLIVLHLAEDKEGIRAFYL